MKIMGCIGVVLLAVGCGAAPDAPFTPELAQLPDAATTVESSPTDGGAHRGGVTPGEINAAVANPAHEPSGEATSDAGVPTSGVLIVKWDIDDESARAACAAHGINWLDLKVGPSVPTVLDCTLGEATLEQVPVGTYVVAISSAGTDPIVALTTTAVVRPGAVTEVFVRLTTEGSI